MIYLDNAATSFPKPPQVAQRMTHYLTKVGASINRSVYGPAQEAGAVTLRLRERLGSFLGFSGKPTHVILTSGCTASLNIAIQGWLSPGDHCVVSAMEHNAVMRPLTALGVDFDRIPCDSTGKLDPADLEPLLRHNTRLVILSHASNVCGTIQDAEAVGAVCRSRGIPLLLDAAQTAGHIPVSFEKIGCSAMAVPGHKGLLGPGGVGALLLSQAYAENLRPLLSGGTGSASHEEVQPHYLPDKFEPGTPNIPGYYGWEAALQWLEAAGIDALRKHELERMDQFLRGIASISGVRLCGSRKLQDRVCVFALDFTHMDNAAAGHRLEQEFGILTRCGLHCAPNAHRTLGTFPGGVVRFSFGWDTTEAQVSQVLQAIEILAGDSHAEYMP